jgi:RNA polymerase sigma factor (TIGR02999 family)
MARDVTGLLVKWRGGDREAAAKLFEAMYGELHRIAARFMRGERSGHTLQPTALVHELYLRLLSGSPVEWQDRAHFLAVAARQARRLLVEHARRRSSSAVKVPVGEGFDLPALADRDVLAVDEALDELRKVDERVASVIELRFFGGLEEDEVAAVLAISASTVKRDWTYGRAWLIDFLRGDGDSRSPRKK